MPTPEQTPASKHDPDVYELEPEPEGPMRTPPGVSADSAHSTHAPRQGSRPGLLEDFDEDADFETDPEVERARRAGVPHESAHAPTVDDDPADNVAAREALFKPAPPSARTLALIACVLVALGTVLAMSTAREHALRAGFAVVFFTLLHTGTGVLAARMTAHLNRLDAGPLDFAASRMGLCVAGFMLCVHVRIAPLGMWDRFVLVPISAGVYVILLRLVWRGEVRTLGVLATMHASLAVLVTLIALAHSWFFG